jgi:ribose transport system permease protein
VRPWPITRRVRMAVARSRYAWFATLLAIGLLIANAERDPTLLTRNGALQTFSTLAPLLLLAIAVTPSLLSGHGGIDLSLAPFAGFCTVLIGTYLNSGSLGQIYVVVPICLVMGLLLGLGNGLIVTVGRLQPIVVTLGTYLVIVGISEHFQPGSGGTVPGWVTSIYGSWTDVWIVAIVIIVWLLAKRTQSFTWLLAVGRDDRTAYASGISVTTVRTAAYAAGGLIAGVAGLAMVGLISGSDSTIGPNYTLTSVAAAALGGTSLAGGAGGILGSFVGAVDIFFVENLLTLSHLSVFALQLAYGAVLVVAVVVNALIISGEGLAVLRAYVPFRIGGGSGAVRGENA